ncbi:flagellar biosynthesis anti-sigma factor FlgM [Caloramator sp. mosi_1]|uniref:flagellar biosynthesis anti-sigma factor FlgM n=1 Tax=Caloramator sp. mosi_1 TaxID=3023090 RepID=UPI00235E8971|nr:flagellar biosynthesis anti-sigma factor FlgM [Caloramator sp. mosi_1]WDC83918.1 flagellar biosynthesis anti-sigma factor FlgM [Caloramator sp. mosi_1]
MKINFSTNNVINIYKKNTVNSEGNKKKLNKSDSIEISDVSKEISKYFNMAKEYDIINEKIDKIKAQIKNNKYEIDTEKIAKSILSELKGSEQK